MSSERFADWFARLRAKLEHAFSTRPEELSDEERAILDRAARLLAQKRVAGAAAMLVESSRPLNFIASQMVAFVEPFVAGGLGVRGLDQLRSALEKRASIDYLIEALAAEEARFEAEDARVGEQ